MTLCLSIENKTALVTDTAVPLTHNLPKTEPEEIINYEKLGPENENVWMLNSVSICPRVISAEGMVIKDFVKHLEYIGLNKNVCKMGQLAVLLQTCPIARNS